MNKEVQRTLQAAIILAIALLVGSLFWLLGPDVLGNPWGWSKLDVRIYTMGTLFFAAILALLRRAF